MSATQTGYVAVYDPKDFESGEFLDYVDEEVIPNVE